jgi:glyoxylase-like metal-dependent hydrolase (beta-lactamase superfamily II)
MIDRRDFLRMSGSCAAHLAIWGPAVPSGIWTRFAVRPAGKVVAVEPWARLEQLGDGVWAVISTPTAGGPDAMRTFSNGGIVAGRSGVLIIEGFASDAGASWIAESAKALTRKTPTHVILTHYHGDHSAGLGGFQGLTAKPSYVTSALTRDRLQTARPPVAQMLAGAELVAPGSPTRIDLGGRIVIVTPRSGHTTSDLCVVVDEPHVVFGGDLLWNGFFPNYVDAIPSVLSREVRNLGQEPGARLIPGHGSIPTRDEYLHYVALLDLIEQAARRAHEAGVSPAVAARDVTIPASLGEWTRFGDSYYEVALKAWERELAR